MKFVSLTTLFAVGLSAVASSQTFSVSGAGGSVPDRPFISFPAWNEAPDWPAFTSTVDVTDPVAAPRLVGNESPGTKPSRKSPAI